MFCESQILNQQRCIFFEIDPLGRVSITCTCNNVVMCSNFQRCSLQFRVAQTTWGHQLSLIAWAASSSHQLRGVSQATGSRELFTPQLKHNHVFGRCRTELFRSGGEFCLRDVHHDDRWRNNGWAKATRTVCRTGCQALSHLHRYTQQQRGSLLFLATVKISASN